MSAVARFEAAFAEYVGAKHAIALCNGTATLHTALRALGVRDLHVHERGMVSGPDRVAVPPLTMASTTIAVLHAGGVPVFCDVSPDTWLMGEPGAPFNGRCVTVSLYGLHHPAFCNVMDIDDAAQTLRPHGACAFTSYSFQASKILPLGEGGMLVTNDADLAQRAREFSSLGYRMDGPVIDKRRLKDPAHERHHMLGWNYRMSEAVAERAMVFGKHSTRWWDELKHDRQVCAGLYRDAVAGCAWITPQHVPDGWTHDYWAYAVALEHRDLWHPFVDAVERHGGTRPFAAWRLTYQEPAFRHLAEDGCCPVAEDLQPRIVAFQTNDVESAKRNAHAVDAAIYELDGVPA